MGGIGRRGSMAGNGRWTELLSFLTTMSTVCPRSDLQFPPHKRARFILPPQLATPSNPPSLPEVLPVADPPPPSWAQPREPAVDDSDDLSVFDILNIFWRCWFLSWQHLVDSALSAQKDKDNSFSWVEFTSQFHSHLVKCAVALVPRLIKKVKRVIFVYILELLNGEGHTTFFELQKGSCKANNAQKEKQQLSWKCSHAAKWEWDCEAAKVATSPPHQQQCLVCGCQFKSCKVARKHKCKCHSKVACVVESKKTEAEVSCPSAPITKDMPMASPPPHAPTVPEHSYVTPAVTRDLQVSAPLPYPSIPRLQWLQNLEDYTDWFRPLSAKEWTEYVANGWGPVL